MRLARILASVALLPLASVPAPARNPSKPACVPFDQAAQHMGTTQCVRGTIFSIESNNEGITFLNFCREMTSCPLSAVVFPKDAPNLGELQQLEGRQIEITGMIESFQGRPQLVLRRSQQLGQSAFLVFPAVPTEYDVEKRGHYSAGKFRPQKAKKPHRKRDRDVSIEDPEEPQ